MNSSVLFEDEDDVPIIPIQNDILEEKKCSLAILREDLLHAKVSGNKFRKLKYNIQKAQETNVNQILTFGGAYSNHIAATAAAGKLAGIPTIGVIRGEELQQTFLENQTLRFAHEHGMRFDFISRARYRAKDQPETLNALRERWGKFYLLPEGGTNELAVKGCSEIIQEHHAAYTHIALAVGTGGTLAGVVTSAFPQQQVLGFSALKGTFQYKTVAQYTSRTNYEITDAYSMGGYAKTPPELIHFINTFYQHTKILLDPVYTAKMVWGILDLVKNDKFPENSRILAIHTGRLQGISGINEQMKKKKQPLIKTSVCDT